MSNHTSKRLATKGCIVCRLLLSSLTGTLGVKAIIKIGVFASGLDRFPRRHDKGTSAINGQFLILNKGETKL